MKRILLIIALLVPVQAWAADTYYVKKTGSDSNTCTQAKSASTPKLTIESALECPPVSGDTVFINDATAQSYSEGNLFIPAGVTIKGTLSAGAPIITVVNAGTSIVISETGDNVTIRDLIINGGTFATVQCNGNSGFLVDNIHIQSSPNDGVLMSNCTDPIVRNSAFDTSVVGTAINVNGGNLRALIDNNTIDSPGQFGIIAFSNIQELGPNCDQTAMPVNCSPYLADSPTANGTQNLYTTISNNTITNTANAATTGIWCLYSYYNLIENNTITNAYFTGIQLETGCRWAIVQNNIINTASTHLSDEGAIWADETVWALIQGNKIHSSHMHDIIVTQSHHVLVRNNQIDNSDGSYVFNLSPGGNVEHGATPGAQNNVFVHNTVYKANKVQTGSIRGFMYSKDESNFLSNGISGCNDCVKNNQFFNNIFSESQAGKDWGEDEDGSGSYGRDVSASDYNVIWNSGRALSFNWGPDPTCNVGTCTAYNFAAYKAATPSSGSLRDVHSINSDPLFTNAAGLDFTLGMGSPAIDAGTFLTTVTTANGSGTSITVADPRFFTNGYGLITGDSIETSAGQKSTISTIDYTTGAITLASSITWTMGDGIGYPYNGTKPDIGALESGNAPACTPHHLTVTVQPSATVLLGNAIGTVVVAVKDSSGNTCTSATNTITLSKNGSATWGTLASSTNLAKAAVAGEATWTFPDLTITTTGGTGTIDAAAGGLTGASTNSISAISVAVDVSGTGVSVSSIVIDSTTQVQATFTITGNATLSARDVTVTINGTASNPVTFTVVASSFRMRRVRHQ